MIPQVKILHRENTHKIDFLRNAVVGCDGAIEPFIRIATHGLSFRQLYGELEADFQSNREAKMATLRDNVASQRDNDVHDEFRLAGVLSDGQAKYKFRSSVPSKKSNSRGKVKRVDPLSIMGCFNCGDPSHMLKDFQKKRISLC